MRHKHLILSHKKLGLHGREEEREKRKKRKKEKEKKGKKFRYGIKCILMSRVFGMNFTWRLVAPCSKVL